MKGYENIAEQIQEIRKDVKGKIYRQQDDLMLEGKYRHWPVFIRLSHSTYTPGLYIQIPVPGRLALFFVPKKLKDQHQAGKVVLQTSDEQFDARIVTRSDQPVQARMLLASERVQQQIQRLCSGSNTLVSVSSGLLEVSESLMPEHDLGYYVINHIKSMAKIAGEVAKLPGADQAPSTPNETKPNRWMRVIVATAVVLLVGLFLVNRALQSPSLFKTTAVPAGMLPADASHIPNLDHWRLAEAQDFDPRGVAWIRQGEKEPSGHLIGRFAGEGFPEESAYALVSDDGRQPVQFRIVLIVNRVVRLDKIYPSIAIMAVVPQPNLGSISWRGSPPFKPSDGDGILIVPKYDDPGSTTIAYIYGKTVLTAGVPADFKEVSIRK